MTILVAAVSAQGQTEPMEKFYALSLTFDRLWRAALSGAKQEVLGMVMDRTVRYGKYWERISLTQFLEGCWSRDGRIIHAGLSIGRTALIATLDHLVKEGILLREKAGDGPTDGYRYSINWGYDIVALLPISKKERVSRSSGLAVPKRMANAKSPENKGVHIPTQGGAHSDTHNKDTNLDLSSHSTNAQSGQDPQTPAGNLARVAGQVVQKRLGRMETKRLDKKSDPDALFNLWWRPTLTENFPTAVVAPWTKKERGNARHLAKEMGDAVFEFISWSLSNWHMVRTNKFPKHRDVVFPDTPDFGFFFAFRRAFVVVFNDRKAAEALATNPKAALVQYLRKQGMTFEQAVEEAGRSQELSAREQALTLREQTVLQAERILELHRRQHRVNAPTATREEFEAWDQKQRSAPRFTETVKPLTGEVDEWE